MIKNNLLLLTFAAAAFALGAFFASSNPFHKRAVLSPGAGISWESWQNSIQDAKINRRPLFIDFYADWCTYCKAMESVYRDAEITRLSNNFACTKVNVDERPDLAQAFHVEGLPTLVFISAAGKAKRLEGYADVSQLARAMLQAAR